LGKIELKQGNEKISLSAKNITVEGLGDLFSLRLIPL
jgi:hypothetical protein